MNDRDRQAYENEGRLAIAILVTIGVALLCAFGLLADREASSPPTFEYAPSLP